MSPKCLCVKNVELFGLKRQFRRVDCRQGEQWCDLLRLHWNFGLLTKDGTAHHFPSRHTQHTLLLQRG